MSLKNVLLTGIAASAMFLSTTKASAQNVVVNKDKLQNKVYNTQKQKEVKSNPAAYLGNDEYQRMQGAGFKDVQVEFAKKNDHSVMHISTSKEFHDSKTNKSYRLTVDKFSHDFDDNGKFDGMDLRAAPPEQKEAVKKIYRLEAFEGSDYKQAPVSSFALLVKYDNTSTVQLRSAGVDVEEDVLTDDALLGGVKDQFYNQFAPQDFVSAFKGILSPEAQKLMAQAVAGNAKEQKNDSGPSLQETVLSNAHVDTIDIKKLKESKSYRKEIQAKFAKKAEDPEYLKKEFGEEVYSRLAATPGTKFEVKLQGFNRAELDGYTAVQRVVSAIQQKYLDFKEGLQPNKKKNDFSTIATTREVAEYSVMTTDGNVSTKNGIIGDAGDNRQILYGERTQHFSLQNGEMEKDDYVSYIFSGSEFSLETKQSGIIRDLKLAVKDDPTIGKPALHVWNEATQSFAYVAQNREYEPFKKIRALQTRPSNAILNRFEAFGKEGGRIQPFEPVFNIPAIPMDGPPIVVQKMKTNTEDTVKQLPSAESKNNLGADPSMLKHGAKHPKNKIH